MGVKRFAQAVGGHWGVENTCHWVLDMTYREDESRIRDIAPLRENFAWINRFTLSITETASGPGEPRHETPQLRLERKVPAGSHYRSNDLVCAGPASQPDLVIRV